MLCGECCRASYEVRVQRKDAIRWMKLNKFALLDNIVIKVECISIDNNTEFNSKEGSTIKEIKQEYVNHKKRLNELIDFIEETHLYFGTSCLRSYIKTVLPDKGNDPVFTPKNFKTLLKGLDFGLKYIIRTDANGACPFLSLNRCSIQEIKPIDCERFPYEMDGSLRKDYPFISICNGLKRMQKHN